MVLAGNTSDLNKTQSDTDDDDQDDASVASSQDDYEQDGALVLPNDANKEKIAFGNIAVSNSTDVHFGIKTYYQGPVTIKQVVYANPNDSRTNECNHQNITVPLSIKDSSVVLDGVPIINENENGVFNKDFAPESFSVTNGKLNNKVDNKISETDARTKLRKGAQWLQNFSRQRIIVVISLVAILVISLVTLLVVSLARHSRPITTGSGHPFPVDGDEQDKGTPGDYPYDHSFNLTLPNKLKIISRKEWVAQPPSDSLNPLKLPAPMVIIMHTATENCTNQAECVFHVRFIQTFHMESRNWSDIGYNFLVGGDGFAYEGRGWISEGAHSYGYNARSIGIAFVGTFNIILPPERQIVAAKRLIERGVEMGCIDKNYKLVAAKQLQTTQSPGELLYQNMKTWPHWTPKP